MIDSLVLPDFWRVPLLAGLLRSPSGSADRRFGDVCAAIRCAALRKGAGAQIWWGWDGQH